MDTNDLTAEKFRLAFDYLRSVNKTELRLVADVCGCSRRHIQGILSKRESKGVSRDVADKIANFFDHDYEYLISLGSWILDGNNPARYVPASSDNFDMSDEYFEHKVICTTCKSIRGYVRGSFTASACIGFCPKCKTQLIHIR